jgi:hypothetical protein
MPSHHSTVPVCDDCLPAVINRDTDHPNPAVAATVELMHNPTVGNKTIAGYFRCFACGHDCIGSSHGSGFLDGSHVTFEDRG